MIELKAGQLTIREIMTVTAVVAAPLAIARHAVEGVEDVMLPVRLLCICLLNAQFSTIGRIVARHSGGWTSGLLSGWCGACLVSVIASFYLGDTISTLLVSAYAGGIPASIYGGINSRHAEELGDVAPRGNRSAIQNE